MPDNIKNNAIYFYSYRIFDYNKSAVLRCAE